MINYIKPACMPYYYDETGKQEYTNDEMRGIAYTADGYLLPCCLCDEIKHRKDFVDLGFYNESLKLSNNGSVDDILHSDNWIKFIDTIMHHPKNATRCCKINCGGV